MFFGADFSSAISEILYAFAHSLQPCWSLQVATSELEGPCGKLFRFMVRVRGARVRSNQSENTSPGAFPFPSSPKEVFHLPSALQSNFQIMSFELDPISPAAWFNIGISLAAHPISFKLDPTSPAASHPISYPAPVGFIGHRRHFGCIWIFWIISADIFWLVQHIEHSGFEKIVEPSTRNW